MGAPRAAGRRRDPGRALCRAPRWCADRLCLVGPLPEAVFLDLGDTLVCAHPSWASVYLSTFPEFGIEATEEQIEEALRTATRSGAWEFEGPFEATEEGSWERIKAFDLEVLAALGHTDVTEVFIRSIERAFAERSAWYIYPDVAPSLDALREAGFRLGIVSNWPWGAPELLHSLELARHFETLVIGARVGYQKPHARIFGHALDQLDVPAARALHVGDSYRNDVLGARGRRRPGGRRSLRAARSPGGRAASDRPRALIAGRGRSGPIGTDRGRR